MNIKKQRVVILIGLFLLFVISIFVFANRKKEIQIIVPIEQNYIEEKVSPEFIIKDQKKDKLDIILDQGKSENIRLTLKVFDENYNFETKKDSTVFDAMSSLEKDITNTNPFSFKYKDNINMGSFITEINGVKGSPGKYWIYYVNDKLASVGVSKYILKEGDIISWKNEGI